jgi:hypothetical protein
MERKPLLIVGALLLAGLFWTIATAPPATPDTPCPPEHVTNGVTHGGCRARYYDTCMSAEGQNPERSKYCVNLAEKAARDDE